MSKPRTRVVVSLAALLAFAACTPELVSFLAPAAVRAGSVFEITAVADHPTSELGDAGCVLQLPNGFDVVAHHIDTRTTAMTVAVDPPPLLAGYTAEPGHHLWAIVATIDPAHAPQNPPGRTTLRVFVRAPAAVSGPFSFKLAVVGGAAGAWTAVAPAGVTQFASITSAAHLRQLSVTEAARPLTAFEVDAKGLDWATDHPAARLIFDDLDGDGDDDVLHYPTQIVGRVGIGFFASRPGADWLARSTTVGNAYWFAAGDFDGDGHTDIVAETGQIQFGDGGSTWTPGGVLPVTNPGPVAVGDVDGDGRADVVHCTSYGVASCYLGNANRTFSVAGAGLPVTPDGQVRNLLLRDLDGDGDLDLYLSRTATSNVFLGDGTGAFAIGSGLPVGRDAVAGDVDADGVNELLLLGTAGSLGVAVYQHVGGGAFAMLPVTGLPTTGTDRCAAVLDFDGDGLLDLVTGFVDTSYTVGVPGTSRLDLYRNLGGGTFQLQADTGLGGTASVDRLFAGDFDGDGATDLVTLRSSQAVFYSNTHGSPFARVQNGCSGQSIRCTGNGALGSMIEVRLEDAGLVPVIGLGIDPTALPLCADCVLGHEWAILSLATDLSLTIPAVPVLTGAVVGFQGAELFVAGGCTPYSVRLTDTVILTIR